MATVDITYAALTDLEGLTGSPDTDTTMTRDGSNGNPSGSYKTLTTTRNQQANNFWYIDTTWEGLGVATGGTVTNIRLEGSDYYAGLSDWNVVDGVNVGPFEVRTQDDATTIATMLSQQTTITSAHSSWQSISAQSDQSIGASYQASNTSIRLRFANYVDLGNNASAAASLHEDNINVIITYTPAATTHYGTATISGTGAIANVPGTITRYGTTTLSGVGAITDVPGTIITPPPPYVLTYRRRIPRRRRLHH